MSLFDEIPFDSIWDLDYDLPAKCKFCGARIQWQEHDDKWRAYTETGRHHVCKPFLKTVAKTPQEDFA